MRKFLDEFVLAEEPEGRIVTPLKPAPVIYEPAAGADGPPPAPEPKPAVAAAPVVAPADRRDSPYRINDVAYKAVIVSKPAPGYTEEARKNNVMGIVRLRAVLGDTGRVSGLSVVKSLPDGLTEKALEAAGHMVFLPAIREGRRVSQYVVIEYNFNIY